MTFSTRAIILKRYKIGEADRLLLAFTEEIGKILVVAKAARRAESKLAGHIEPYALTNLEISPGKGEFYHLTGAQNPTNFLDINLNITALRHIEILGEVIDLTLGDAETNPKAFSKLVDGILAVRQNPANSHLISIEYLVKILESIGFKPELQICSICQNRVLDMQNGWSSLNGGIVCHDCCALKASIREVQDNRTISLLRVMQSEDNAAGRLKVDLKHITEAHGLVVDYLLTHLSRPLKSLS